MSSPSDKRDEDLPSRYLKLPDKVEQQLSESGQLFKPPTGISYEEFHERLWLDEDLWQGIRRRFESNRDAYPALSELLSNMSDKEVENFFRFGGTRAWSSLKLPEKPGLALRQLRSLLYKEFDFYARHPEAARLLYATPHPEGKAEVTGLPLPSFGIRILRHDPSPTVFPPDQSVGEGDAKSATYPLHGEMGLLPVNQALGPVEGGFLNGVLLAILSREERAANIMYSRNFEEDLLEGVEGTDKPPVRITDLRLAVHLEPGILGRVLVPALGSLPRPISAEGVVRWKRRALGGTKEEFETEEEVRERATAEDLDPFAEQAERKVDRSLEDYPGETPRDRERLRDPLLRSATWDLAWEARRDLSLFQRVEHEFGNPYVGTAAVSFAAAALLLFIDLDMPGIRESKPFRLAEQIESLAQIIRDLAVKLGETSKELGSLLANRGAGRQARSEGECYRALKAYRTGYAPEDISRWLGITPYSSKTGVGTRDWKARLRRILARGEEAERKHYPRVAAVFANQDNSHVRRKAEIAYLTYEEDEEKFGHQSAWWNVGRKIHVAYQTQRGAEMVNAYIELGSCLVDEIPPRP